MVSLIDEKNIDLQACKEILRRTSTYLEKNNATTIDKLDPELYHRHTWGVYVLDGCVIYVGASVENDIYLSRGKAEISLSINGPCISAKKKIERELKELLVV